jgi:hypothetical protein
MRRNSDRRRCNAILVMASMALALCPPFAAAEPLSLKDTFVFSAGYRSGAQNIVELGIAAPCARGWCLTFSRYRGADNLPYVKTPYRHAMHAGFHSSDCSDEQITTINPSTRGETKAVLRRASDNGFVLVAGSRQYEWKSNPETPHAYLLARIKGVSEGREADQADQIVGFGFSTDKPVQGSIAPAQLAFRFDGEIYHKNAHAKVADQWEHHESSLDFRLFTPTAHGAVLSLTQPGQPAEIKRYRKQLWVQNSVILHRGRDVIAPVIQEYGHDFNANGCFDEHGHNKLLLPVAGDAEAITAFVYIEYSPDENDGVPMISVGRYYR